MKKTQSYIEVFLAFISLLCVFLFFPIIYDESYDSFCNNQLASQFTDKPLMDLYYLAWVGFNEIYKFLHEFFPSINWGGIAFLGFNGLGLYIALYTVRLFMNQMRHKYIYTLSFQILISIIYLDNLISITHTRFSILFCGLALILLAIQKNLTKKQTFFYTLLFIVGMLHRPESGLGLFFFIGIGMLFFFGIQSWVLINRWKYPFISLLILLGIFYLDWQKTTYFERKIEPDIEYALTTQRVLDISEMMTYEDSLKFQMTRYGIFIDDEFVSLDYLKRITSVAYNFNPPKFKKSLATILDFGSYYVYFPVFLFVVLLFPLINRRWLLVLSIVLLNTVYFLLYAYIEYNTDISNRHLSPFLVLQVLLNILLLFKYHKIQGLQSFAFLFSMFILLIFAWRTLQNYSTKYNILHQEVSCLEKTMESIEKQYQNQIIVISLFNYRLLDHPFSFYTNNYKANTYILYDLSYYSLVPPNEQYLAKLCACDPENPLEFFTWLQEVNGLYVSVEPRFELIENYMNFNHGVDFKFVQFDQDLKLIKPACILNSQQGEFEMKRIFMSK